MILGAQDPGVAGAVCGSVVTTLIGALVGAVVLWMNTRHKNRMEAAKARSDEDDRALPHFRELAHLYAAKVAEQDEMIGELFAAEMECAAELNDQHGWMLAAHAWMVGARGTVDWMGQTLARLGEPPADTLARLGPVPDVPPRPKRERRRRAEFLARTSQQSTTLIREVAEKTVPPPPSPGGP